MTLHVMVKLMHHCAIIRHLPVVLRRMVLKMLSAGHMMLPMSEIKLMTHGASRDLIRMRRVTWVILAAWVRAGMHGL